VKDGKSGAFDEAIERIMGSPSMFYTSVCRPQKARDISSYSRGDIMAVIIELLNLEPIRLQGEKSKEVIKVLEALVQNIVSMKTPIAESLLGRQGLLTVRDGHEAALESLASQNSNLSVSLSSSETRLHEIELAAASETVSRRRLEEMIAREKDLATEIQTVAAEKSKRSGDLVKEIKIVDDERTSEDLAASKDIGNLESRIESAQVVISRADEIRAAVEQERDLATQLTVARSTKEACAVKYRSLAEKSNRAAKEKAGIEAAKKEVKIEEDRRRVRKEDLGREKDRCLLQVATLDAGLDCKADGSKWINETCPLLQDALKARERIEDIDGELASLATGNMPIDGRPSLDDLNSAAAKLEENWRTEFATVDADLKACTEEGQKSAALITSLETDLKKAQETASLIFDLETAEERVGELTEQINTRSTERTRRLDVLSARRQELADKLQEYEAEMDQKISDLQKKKAAQAEDAAILRNTLDGNKDAELAATQGTIAGLKKQITEAEETTRKTHASLGAVIAQLEDLDKKESELTKFDERIARINTELIAWKVLAKACSNDGILNLEIEDSGPSVSAKANDLLSSCYGPRFSVRIETQAEKADGDMKNVFDITVFDSERDEEKSIKDMSGGEDTTIEDAVVRAFNLFNLHKGDRHFDTILSDEKDGGLDIDKKLAYFAVKKKALEIGQHSREFFISHTPELQEMADARIILSKGGVQIDA
jgi:exonuclease SbcC